MTVFYHAVMRPVGCSHSRDLSWRPLLGSNLSLLRPRILFTLANRKENPPVFRGGGSLTHVEPLSELWALTEPHMSHGKRKASQFGFFSTHTHPSSRRFPVDWCPVDVPS